MLKDISIKNFKSIEDMNISLGRINVFIGENGSGKSNVLEAIALAGSANSRKLDNEFLAARGIRVTQPRFMHPAFKREEAESPINITVSDTDNKTNNYKIYSGKGPYPQWRAELSIGSAENSFKLMDFIKITSEYLDQPGVDKDAVIGMLDKFISRLKTVDKPTDSKRELANLESTDSPDRPTSRRVTLDFDKTQGLAQFLVDHPIMGDLHEYLNKFLIFSPENSALRTFEREGQVEPLGINGEGLLKLLSVMSTGDYKKQINSIKSSLKLLGWFGDFRIVEDPVLQHGSMEIKDIFLHRSHSFFDQKSANEGFLFLLFYFTLFSSDLTPPFFAIDNIDASLNPKLCEALVRRLSELAATNGKQVIMTTHNPAVLDGLNLEDQNQKLFVIYRGRRGQTMIQNISKPNIPESGYIVKLSEAFMRGTLGGLPKHF